MNLLSNNSRPLILVALLSSVIACSSMNSSQKDTATRTGVGAAVGMAAGGLIDHGGAGGLAAGAAIGALGGWLYDKHEKGEGN